MSILEWVAKAGIGLGGILLLFGGMMQLLLGAISFIKQHVFGASPEFGIQILDWSEIRGWRGAALYPMVLGLLACAAGLAVWLVWAVADWAIRLLR